MKIQVMKLSSDEIKAKGILNWPVWTKEVSDFDWYYDTEEQCLFLEGEVSVDTDEGSISFGAGDYVVFPAGLKCVWHVKSPVRKHYKFS